MLCYTLVTLALVTASLAAPTDISEPADIASRDASNQAQTDAVAPLDNVRAFAVGTDAVSETLTVEEVSPVQSEDRRRGEDVSISRGAGAFGPAGSTGYGGAFGPAGAAGYGGAFGPAGAVSAHGPAGGAGASVNVGGSDGVGVSAGVGGSTGGRASAGFGDAFGPAGAAGYGGAFGPAGGASRDPKDK